MHTIEPAAHLRSRRCPVCFSRDIDVLLLPRHDGQFYCVKCSFVGTEGEIRGMYRDSQKKFHGMVTRYTMEDLRRL